MQIKLHIVFIKIAAGDIMKDFIISQKNNIWFGSFPLLTEAGFTNACSCRLHGESAVVSGTLNLALHVGDEPELVLRNRERFAQAIGVEAKRLTTCAQVHGSEVAVVDETLMGAGAFALADTVAGTDALITKLPEVPLLLFYADCVPVLLADTKSGAVGLAHAGWRGTVAQIVRRTVQAMADSFGTQAQDIAAAIAPSIGQCCYEVDDFVRDKARGYEEFFAPAAEEGKYMLDLWGYNKRQLLEAGVLPEKIAVAEVCTAHNHELFCSYRAEAGRTGRMGVCIMARK